MHAVLQLRNKWSVIRAGTSWSAKGNEEGINGSPSYTETT